MKHAAQSDYLSNDALEPFVDLDEGTIEPLTKFYQGCITCATEMNAEAARFVQHRIVEDYKASQEIVQCKNPIEIYNKQIGFCARMLNDYMQETQKMIGLVQTLQQPNGRPKLGPQSTTATGHDDVVKTS